MIPNVASWLPSGLGPLVLLVNGQVVTKRLRLNFSSPGATTSDDPDNDQATIALGAASYDEKAVAWLEDPTFANLQDAVTGEDVVSRTANQTLTTKTISADDNTITCSSGAAGDLLVHNGTKFVRLAKGSANQVLRVNAGATALEWAAPSGGVSVSGTGLVTVTGGALDGAAFALGTNVPAWLAAPSSANLAAAITDETGSGALVFGTSPTFKTSLIVRNPADTFGYTLTPAAIAANRTLNLPLLTGTDTLVTEAHAQPLSNKTFGSTNLTTLRLNKATTTLTGTQTALSPGDVSFLRVQGAGSLTIQGLVAGVDGQILLIKNAIPGGSITMVHESVSASAANRYTDPSGADYAFSENATVALIYDATSQRWVRWNYT